MYKLMKVVGFTVALLVALQAPQAFAGDDELDRKIEEARERLDRAARELAELHSERYEDCCDSQKPMLGILLGDGPMQGGVELVGVTPGWGAEAAGLKAGDKIVRIGDESLATAKDPVHELVAFMKQVTPGESVAVVYERDGELKDATIVTHAMSGHIMKVISDNVKIIEKLAPPNVPKVPQAPHFAKRIEKILMQDGTVANQLMYVSGDLAEYFDIDSGVVLVRAEADSPLKAGDVLLSVGGDEIGDIDEALEVLGRAAKEDDPVTAVVKRKGKRRNLELDADALPQARAEGVQVIRIKTDGGTSGTESDIHIEVRD